MDFQLTTEQQLIYDYGGAVAKDLDYKYWTDKARKNEFTQELWDRVAADGFLGIMVPEEYGGAGLGMMEMALLMEGLSNHGIPLLMLVVGPTMSMGLIAKHASEEMKRAYLPDLCAGKTQFCFAITEPDAGSNSIKIQTFAKARGNRFALKGTKTFITGADVADYALVVSRTTPFDQGKRKTDGFTLFAVNLKDKNVEKHLVEVSIPTPDTQWTLFFDDVDLGPENVIGEVGKGFDILFDSLNPERIVLAAQCAGIGRFVIDKAVEYTSERVVFDAPIGSYQGLQHPLAEAKTQIEMSSLMMRNAAWLYDSGKPAGPQSNMAKYAAAEASIKAVDTAIQCHGGNGFTKDYSIYDYYPMVRLMRTAPVNRELILNYIAEKVLGMPRSY